jgi:hypothetical protein
VAFRRGLGVLSGREPLPTTSDGDLDDLIATVMEAEAGEALNGWRVLHRLRTYEHLELEVEQLDDENKLLNARALPNRKIETIDQAALARRLFDSSRNRR